MSKFSSGLVPFAILHNLAMLGAGFFYLIGLVLASRHGEGQEVGLVMMVIALFLFLITVVFFSLILHRGWSFVQDGQARTTPGKAVGYLFIPFYNLYWRFVANYGLMKEFNRLAAARGRSGVTAGLALAYAIVMLIPFVNLMFGPILEAVVIWQIVSFIRENEG